MTPTFTHLLYRLPDCSRSKSNEDKHAPAVGLCKVAARTPLTGLVRSSPDPGSIGSTALCCLSDPYGSHMMCNRSPHIFIRKRQLAGRTVRTEYEAGTVTRRSTTWAWNKTGPTEGRNRFGSEPLSVMEVITNFCAACRTSATAAGHLPLPELTQTSIMQLNHSI
jgi:hypothetical protein